MKKIALAFGLLFALPLSLLATEEQTTTIVPENKPAVSNQYGYFELGFLGSVVPFVLPEIAGGYRVQRGAHGFDANLQFATIGYISEAKLGLHYLHYFQPDIQNEYYLGIGPAIGGIYGIKPFKKVIGYGMAPELVFGKQYMTDSGSQRHIQANVIWPTYTINAGHHYEQRSLWCPIFSISYGWGF